MAGIIGDFFAEVRQCTTVFVSGTGFPPHTTATRITTSSANLLHRKLLIVNGLKSSLIRVVSAIAFVSATSFGVTAQSTVFNIPSTDVQTRKSLYVEADFAGHLSSFETGGYQSYGFRTIYGLDRRVEIGFNAFFTRTAPAEPIEIQPNFKFRFYKNESNGVAAAAGIVGFIPVTHRNSNSTRVLVYGVASKSTKGSYGPRFTAGAYSLIGVFEEGISKRGVLVGYEQPVTRTLTFVTDWSSGHNDYGYVVAGVGIALTPKSFLYAGYNVGNQDRGNNSCGIFYGHSF